MNRHAFFIAGTDTDVGKTFVARGILSCANDLGLTTAGYKPVSAGCEISSKGLRNEDALILQNASSLPLTYDEVNPIAFADPVAPHLAALRNHKTIDASDIVQGYKILQEKKPDLLLVEGAGGWRLPLNNEGRFLSDVVKQLQLPVVLVVGMKLGCLNHAMLTVEAIERDGLRLAGWVANLIDGDMLYQRDNLDSLKALIQAPCLGVVPQMEDDADVNTCIDIKALLSAVE